MGSFSVTIQPFVEKKVESCPFMMSICLRIGYLFLLFGMESISRRRKKSSLHFELMCPWRHTDVRFRKKLM